MEILLAGNTTFVTQKWISTAFPRDHVLMTTNGGEVPDPKVQAVPLQSKQLLQQLVQTYEFDRIVYFSEYLTPHGEQEGELDRLRRMLQANRERSIQLLYLAGPESVLVPSTGKSVLAQSAEMLCRHYAQNSSLQVKILHLPYLYGTENTGGCEGFAALFAQAQTGCVRFDEQAQQPVYALCMEDLAELVARIFDCWTSELEEFTVPIAAPLLHRQLGEQLQQLCPGLQLEYGTDTPQRYPADDGVLRTRYGWFAHYSLADDLPGLWQSWQAAHAARETRAQRFWQTLRGKKRLLIFLEILATWLGTEALVRLTGVQAQFRMVDFRLLFVVLAGTVYGMNEGVLAAALAAVSLVVGYARQGIAPILLFYEPSYWLAFLVYFLAGAVCGYAQLHNTEIARFAREECTLLQQRLQFVRQLYQDTLEEKRALRRQLLGRKDSYGKLYAVTRQLDVLQPQALCRRALQALEQVLENHTLAIYQVDGSGRFARLTAACPAFAAKAPHTLTLKNYGQVLQQIRQEGTWVNRGLQAGLPMYAAAVRQNGTVEMLVLLFEAGEEQCSLYYQNLFRIFCGLTETALMRAKAYESATARERYLAGTRLLRKPYFARRLAASCALQEDKMAHHLLLRVGGTFQSSTQLWMRLQDAIRREDAAGVAADDSICLLLEQAAPADLPALTRRLAAKGITVQAVPWEEQQRLAGQAPEVAV